MSLFTGSPQHGATPGGLRNDRAAGASRRVVVASDVRLYSEGLTHVLSADGRLFVSGVVDAAARTVDAVVAGDIDALLLDGTMAGACEALNEVRARIPPLPVVIFSVPDDDDELLAFVEAGATAFVARNAPSRELIETVLSALGASLLVPRSSAQMLLRLARRTRAATGSASVPQSTTDLTRREREIARLLDTGLSNKEIAGRLSISVATVKNHVHRVLEKLHVQRRGQAAHRLRHDLDQRI
jgi:two-component system nitrate/nitrite response regulator NarL